MQYLKRFANAFLMSLGMFCAIPLPSHLWDESSLNLVLPCLPLVGILLGTIWWGIARFLVFFGIHTMLTSAILAVTPFLLTGFLHLDGYMDTSDAVLSRRPLEDKMRILKDPHIGAFAAISLAVLFVLQFASVYSIIDRKKGLMMLVFISVISRCCASVSLLILKAMPQSSYAKMFGKDSHDIHKGFLIVTAIVSAATACMFCGPRGLAAVLITVLGFTCAMVNSYRRFRGVSGDLAGYSIVIGELCGLMTLAVL